MFVPVRLARQCPVAVCCAVLGLGLAGCESCASPQSGARGANPADAGSAGLSREQAQQVLARVGTRTITLGDYAAALERMDPFERMRYQTEDRRQALLDEMINVELLAREAERRGLDRQPETVELVRQFQRDELLRRLRAALPGPSEIPAAEVRAYYQEHRTDFFDPERRRAAQIVLTDPSLAARVLGEARTADAEQWRALVAKYNPEALGPSGDKTVARPPLGVAGDLGMLNAPSAAALAPASAVPAPSAAPSASAVPGTESAVPEALRRAVFQIAEPGQVFPEPVALGGRFYVLRLVSKQEARQRSLEEADTMVRARLVQAQQERARAELLERLRRDIPVQIDEAALERVPPPGGSGP